MRSDLAKLGEFIENPTNEMNEKWAKTIVLK
jgi:hypothetical protein